MAKNRHQGKFDPDNPNPYDNDAPRMPKFEEPIDYSSLMEGADIEDLDEEERMVEIVEEDSKES